MALSSATWQCDRDGVEGTSQTEAPPEGWWRIEGFSPGFLSSVAVLCPNCAAAHAEFMGMSFARKPAAELAPTVT
jgi:hypothetical protein